MKHNYFTEVSLFLDIIPQQPDALVSSWQGIYNCHGRKRLLNYSCCRIGDLASVVSLAQK